MYKQTIDDAHCDPKSLAADRDIRKTCVLTNRNQRQLADGTFRISAKATDTFHFVSHPWFCTDSKDRLLRAGCDCGQDDCEHLAALTRMHFSAETPEPVIPESEMLPVPSPIVPPMRIVPELEKEANPEPARAFEPRSMEICFGAELDSQNPVMWYPNDTERVFHTNLGIIGTMGTGKTQLTKSIIAQLCHSQNDNFDGRELGILIFDYKGDYNETKTDFLRCTGATVLKPYRLPYNPLALHRSAAFRPLLPIHTANTFKDTISKIFNLGAKQQHLLFECIVAAYAHQGIDPALPATWDRPAPTFEQVYQIFLKKSANRPMDLLSAAMDKIHQFCLFEGDPRKARSLGQILKGVVSVDLSSYDRDIQSLIVAITLDQFYAYMHKIGSSSTDGRYRQLRYLILVDEADSFMAQGFTSLKKILKEGREFGVGALLSTQSLSHFTGGDDDYSRYILTWVVHNVSDLKQRDVEYIFKLHPKSPEVQDQCMAIRNLRKHESVIKLPDTDPMIIKDKAFWQLYSELGL